MARSLAKAVARKKRHKPRKAASKMAGKVRKKVAAERFRDTQGKTDARLEPFRGANVQDTFRRLAERNVAQTRNIYELSRSSLQALLESWQKSFGAAGQGVVAFNRTIFDIGEHNINTGFELATDLAGAKNFAEVMELQTTYWRKHLDHLRAQTEEVRALSTEITGNVMEAMKTQVTEKNQKNVQ